MKLLAVNGSPRKKWNTAQLLESVVEGAKSVVMEAKLVHIYDLEFKGCISCFSCKQVGGASYGRCAVRDGLTPLLDEVHNADALVLGSPLYFMSETGEMRSFLERACYPYICYRDPPMTLFPREIRNAFIYTMDQKEDHAMGMRLLDHLNTIKFYMELVFGPCEFQICYDTLQCDDYKAHGNVLFDGDAKKQRREEVFPKDIEQAFELGADMALPWDEI